MRYQFDLTINRVTLQVPFDCGLLVTFARGPKRQETKTKARLSPMNSVAEFGETLSMLGTIYKNKAQGTFTERKVSYRLKLNIQ
jgi:hypothetical protein